jgi:hypothetical protein
MGLNCSVAVLVACLFTFIGARPALAQDTDLDALMARALERRNETWRVLHDYVLDERERFALLGPSDLRLFGVDRRYTWYVRDGLLVRSPVRFDGVDVPEKERREFEERWIAEERERAERAAKRAAERAAAKAKGEPAPQTEPETEPETEPQAEPETEQEPEALTQPAGPQAGDATAEIVAKGIEPRFVSEAYFLQFRFERGRYFLAGKETLDGRPVLKVEYYPTKLFRDDREGREPKKPARDGDPKKKFEVEIDRKFNKVSLVTLWIDPAEAQIVRYDFENLGMDFLPGRWLVRVGETTASMTMGRYFDGVWLPKSIAMRGDLQVAIGSFDIDYRREFLEYRKAETSAHIRYYGDVK